MEKAFKIFLEKSENDPYEEENWGEDNRFMVVIGDWSDDGHGHSEYFVYSSNYPVEILRQAYKDSCKLTGVQFNHNQDYTGRGPRIGRNDWTRICTEYEDNVIQEEAVAALGGHGIDLNMFEDNEDDDHSKVVYDNDQFANLILRFIRLSLPDFKWEEAAYKRSEIRHEVQPLNGYWNPDLNVQFGYGLYAD
jgi:hypothetical protein